MRLSLLVTVALAPAAAYSGFIDSFEFSPFIVTDAAGGSTTVLTQNGVPETVDGVRQILSFVQGGTGTATYALAVTPGDDAAVFSVDANTGGFGQLTYLAGPAAPFYNIAALGDRLLVAIASATPGGTLSVRLQDTGDRALSASALITGAGVYEFVFASMTPSVGPIDLTHVSQTQVLIAAGPAVSPQAFAISSITVQSAAVPEPSSLLLLAVAGLGGAGAALRRRYRPAAGPHTMSSC